jgi:hypothetical protein
MARLLDDRLLLQHAHGPHLLNHALHAASLQPTAALNASMLARFFVLRPA